MDHLDFKTFFYDKLKERGLTLRRLSELTGITVEHLQNLGHENFEKLPSAPYLKGYLAKLGAILEFDPAVWWDYFEGLKAVKSSGPMDELPQNRFAQKPMAKYAWLIILGATVLVYLLFQFPKIIGRPVLILSNPAAETGIKTTQVNFKVEGTARGANSLSINGEAVAIDHNGNFEKIITLQPGLNTIEVRAVKFLGGETSVTRQVLYEALPETTPLNSVSTSTTIAPNL